MGLEVNPNPLQGLGKVNQEKQSIPWPGQEKEMKPRPDHGETSYRGSGKLAGMKALVTGGDSGIGKAVAIAFAREGADVSIAYLNEHEDAQDTVQWVEKAGRQALAIPGDLQDVEHCRTVVRQAFEKFGRLDILVNNAAYQHELKDFSRLTPEELEKTFRTNIFAYIWLAQAALEHLKQGGIIINTGSVTGLEGHPTLLDYSATKGAIHTFTKSLAGVVASRGIRVNCVAPGPVWTPLVPATTSPEHVEKSGQSTLWKRPAQPAEIAPSFVFLASSDSLFYTGEILAPTGSVLAR
ncbi:MAG TPA: NAD(P)-dependent oxidoreductase [Cyanobacteria bacterium UBA8530]|nr:NAD(P)-dependent oxidoreductase [Cyanobacteria bacterium UBA8530]